MLLRAWRKWKEGRGCRGKLLREGSLVGEGRREGGVRTRVDEEVHFFHCASLDVVECRDGE